MTMTNHEMRARTVGRGITFMTRRHHTADMRRGIAAGLTMLGLVAGCKGALDVVLPGKVSEDALQNPGLAATMVASTQGDFECAFSEFVHTTGLWSNELLNSSGTQEANPWGARLTTYDRGV